MFAYAFSYFLRPLVADNNSNKFIRIDIWAKNSFTLEDFKNDYKAVSNPQVHLNLIDKFKKSGKLLNAQEYFEGGVYTVLYSFFSTSDRDEFARYWDSSSVPNRVPLLLSKGYRFKKTVA